MDFDKEAREILAFAAANYLTEKTLENTARSLRRAFLAGQEDARSQLAKHFAAVSSSAPIHCVQLSDAAQKASEAVRHFRFTLSLLEEPEKEVAG